MELIERYLQQIGRHLPQKQRADILSELRSALMDTLEARSRGEPTDDDVVQVIREMGPPQKVASSYHPQGEYLIGPELYPTFKLVLGIVFTSIIGAQLLALMVVLSLGEETVSFLDEFLGITNSLPSAIGIVVVVFALLQRFGVRPEGEETEFDPRKLPPLEGDEPINRGEQIFGIIVEVVVLAILAQFAMGGGFIQRGLFENPVINQYFFWIALSMTVSIVLDIWLLWKGRWQTPSRIAKIGADVFSMVVLFILIQSHNAWLAEMGVGGFLQSLNQLAEPTARTTQIIGMAAFRMALTVALIITAIEMLVQFYRLIKAGLRVNEAKQIGMAAMVR